MYGIIQDDGRWTCSGGLRFVSDSREGDERLKISLERRLWQFFR